MTVMAPTKAARSTAMKPEMEKSPAVTVPPSSSSTSATPSEAPLLMPKMEGPASGFRKAVCSISPHTASDAPQSMAVMACGNRLCSTMYCHDGFCDSCPVRMLTTSSTGIFTAPTTRHSAKSTAMRSSISSEKRKPLDMIWSGGWF